MVTVRTPSFSLAATFDGSTRRGNQTVRVNDDVPTKERSVDICVNSGADVTAVVPT